MYIKGGSRRNIGFWAKHLSDDKTNDRAELVEKRGLAADNLRDMMREMLVDAKLTRARNFMYIASFNPTEGETLTERQWERAYEIFENERGIPEGQQRIVYEHEKKGRVHRHVVWNRIDTENMRAFPDSLDLKVCEAAKHIIENELELQRTPGLLKRDPELPPPDRNPPSWEMFRGQKSGIDPRDVKTEVTAIFRESEGPADFVAGLEAHGYQLCIGDRRGLVILDTAGQTHSLARRLDRVNAKELNAFMAGYDRAALPSVDQAKEQHRERAAENRAAELADVQKEIQREEALANAAMEKEKPGTSAFAKTADELARGGREKERQEQHWRTGPPQPEPGGTSPRHHFEDAARATAQPEAIPATPENVQGTAADIWATYNRSRTGQDFATALEGQGFALAAATKDEAERSHREAEFAKAVGNYAPRYREGEIVAVSASADVYQLNYRTTGDDRAGVEKFLAKLDRVPLQGIETTKLMMHDRAEQYEAAAQVFSLMNPVKTPERDTRPTPQPGRVSAKENKALPVIAKALTKGPAVAFGALAAPVHALADAFSSLLGGSGPPKTQAEIDHANEQQERAADSAGRDAAAAHHNAAYQETQDHIAARQQQEAQRQQQQREDYKRHFGDERDRDR